MLSVNEVSISFSGEYLYKEISFRLLPGDRVGLIGKNGAGKSTLLKVLSGQIQPDTGQVAKEKNVSIGVLRQDIDFETGRSVIEEAYTAFETIRKLETQIAAVNESLATRTDYESEAYMQLIQDLSDLTHEFEIQGGYHYQGETEKILKGLAFAPEDFHKPVDALSGGWRMRVELARLLLQNHDVLLLDEPTNHLDIESILWFEQFLIGYPGAVVLVSHDKTFLDNVTNRTIEISLGKIYDYPKPYSEFIVLRKELREQQLATFKNQQKEIERTEKLIDRFKAKASKASMAQSLMKKLDKIDRVEVDEEDSSVMKLRFADAVQPGKVIFELHQISKTYGEQKVLDNISYQIDRNDRIAFVGQNGQGKSTLAKIMVEEIDFQGKLRLGHNVKIGYFAQNQSEYLNPNKTVLDTMLDAANDSNRIKVRDMLGAFLFRGDEVHKKVSVLSGGERNRLALCKMLLEPINTLIMDEPTNHLDLQSKQVLKDALKQFDGTLIVVSHDRDFLDGLTDKVLEFRNFKIKEYLGDINYFLEERAALNMREVERKEQTSTKASKVKSQHIDNKTKKKLQNKLSNIEQQIAEKEEQIKEFEQQIAQQNQTDASDFSAYESLKADLEVLMSDWEALAEQLD